MIIFEKYINIILFLYDGIDRNNENQHVIIMVYNIQKFISAPILYSQHQSLCATQVMIGRTFFNKSM